MKNQMLPEIGEISSLQVVSNGTLEDPQGMTYQNDEGSGQSNENKDIHQNSHKVIKYLAYQKSRPKSSQIINRRTGNEQNPIYLERGASYGSQHRIKRASLDYINLQNENNQNIIN